MRSLLTLLLLLVPLRAAPPTAAETSRHLDAFLARVMATAVTPGMAVAVVRGDQVIYAKGFGFADQERHIRTTADTQFYLASTTKSFTSLAAAILASHHSIDLDESLAHALPSAHWHPQLDPDHITLRQLLTHTHGIQPNGPVDFRTAYTGDFTQAQLLDLLRYHAPSPQGHSFVYSNLGYNIFSLVLDARFPEGWKTVLQRQVFDPLGMRSTTCWISRADPRRLAQPYELQTDGPQRVPFGKTDANMHAAGGVISTAHDLARYLLAELHHGRIGRRQLLPAAAIDETQRLQASQDRHYGSFVRTGTGLGWDIARYDNALILQRFGAFSGFDSHVSFMPDSGLGVVVLSNGGTASGIAADLVATHIYDYLLQKPNLQQRSAQRWTAFETTLDHGRQAIAKDAATRRARPQTTRLPLTAYTGTFDSPSLGRMIWTLSGDRLHIQMGVATSGAEVYDATLDRFRVTLTGSGSVVTFEPSGDAPPASLQFLGEPFTRQP